MTTGRLASGVKATKKRLDILSREHNFSPVISWSLGRHFMHFGCVTRSSQHLSRLHQCHIVLTPPKPSPTNCILDSNSWPPFPEEKTRVPGKSQRDREVPTSSMADIAFLLLIFFLVTTILNIGQRIGLILLGQKKQPLRTRNIAELLVNADGETCFEDGIVEAFEIHRRVGRRLLENQNLVIVIKIDLKNKLRM